jgi:hypothetical protein
MIFTRVMLAKLTTAAGNDPAQMIEMNIPVLSNRLQKTNHIMSSQRCTRQIIAKGHDVFWFYCVFVLFGWNEVWHHPYMIESKLTKWLNRNNISWDHSLSGSLQIRLTCVYLMWRFLSLSEVRHCSRTNLVPDMYENTRIYIHIFLLSCKCSVNDDSHYRFCFTSKIFSDYVTEINRLYWANSWVLF